MNTRVFLGGIAPNTREKDVERFFRKYGRIREISIKSGFAFVEFESRRDADDAIYEMNGRELLGEKISVERARGSLRSNDSRGSSSSKYVQPSRTPSRSIRYGPPQRTRFRLVVENLSRRVSWQDLKDYMRKGGEVTYADAHRQRKNEGVVEFASHRDMDEAMDRLNYTELFGRKIKLIREKSRKSRSSSRHSSSSSQTSRSRSPRSRSRSRSSSTHDKKERVSKEKTEDN